MERPPERAVWFPDWTLHRLPDPACRGICHGNLQKTVVNKRNFPECVKVWHQELLDRMLEVIISALVQMIAFYLQEKRFQMGAEAS